VCAPSSGGTHGITTTTIGGYTSHFGGTSSAAPLAAGIAALLLSVNPSLRWDEVRDLLRRSADRIDTAGGRYDARGHSPAYGYGRVNALRALHAISALEEAARGSDLALRIAAIRGFGEVLEASPAGREILSFLERKKLRILELLNGLPSFRQHAVTILHATADLHEDLSDDRPPSVPERAWDAVAAIAPLLLN
jgi:hypothetical protein